jgi:hypothetical protein
MQKLFNYDGYNKYSELLESVSFDSKLAYDYHTYVRDSLVNESIFTKGGGDQILNTLSKSLFGSLSKVSMIDQTIEKIYSLKAKMIDQEYTMDKAFDALADRMKELRSSGATPETVRAIRKQRDAKEAEFRALEKRGSLEIEKGLKLLEDIIGGNKRRQAYADSVLAQAEVNLADHEVKKARREGKASEREVSKLMQKLEDKKRELREETEDLEKLAQKEAQKDSKPEMKVTKGGKSA